MENLADIARQFLKEKTNPQQAEKRKQYMRSPFVMMGVTKKDINAIGKQLRPGVCALDHEALLEVLEDFWQSGVHEEMALAIELGKLAIKNLSPEDVPSTFSRWVDDIRTWDHLDELCLRVIGPLALRDESLWAGIQDWMHSEHMWKRRASVVSHLPAMRAGQLRAEQFERTCLALAHEKDFFIRKAIGWTLRELSYRDEETMAPMFRRIGGRLSPLSRKEATRKLDEALRDSLLEETSGN